MDNPNFRFVKADICDREAVYKLFEEENPDMDSEKIMEKSVRLGYNISIFKVAFVERMLL